MSHLGDRVAAFVDGQLTPESAERATAHLAFCRPCRDLVELERLTKARLCALRGPEPTADLVGRLMAMGGPAGPMPPRPGHVPGTPRPAPVPVRAPVGTVQRQSQTQRRSAPSTRPAGRPAVLGGRRGRLAVAVAGALSVVGVGVAGVAAGSGVASGGARPASPQVDTILGGGAATVTTSAPRPTASGGAQLVTTLVSRLAPGEWVQTPRRSATAVAKGALGR